MDSLDYDIDRLRTAIEDKLGRTFKSPIDFEFLSRKMKDELEESLSSSTLMRIWKYLHSDSIPRLSSLSLLSRYVGYKDFETFRIDVKRQQANESGYINVRYVGAEDLKTGDLVRVSWQPDRQALFRSLGDCKFRVESCSPCTLKPGDVFSTAHFQKHVPLFALDLNDGSGTLKSYVAGRTNGLTDVTIITKIIKPK